MLSEKFVDARMGDMGNTYSNILVKNKRYQELNQILSKATKAVLIHPSGGDENWNKYDAYENALAEMESFCQKEAYKFGYEDGRQVGREERMISDKSILTMETMVHLIYVYDALTEIGELFLGAYDMFEPEDKEEISICERIYEVIKDGACMQVRLENWNDPDGILDILDNKELTLEEKAKLLIRY